MIRFILAAITLMLLSACNDRGHVLTRAERMVAEIGARDFGEKNNLMFVGCFGKDMNNNGEVSCTMRRPGEIDEKVLLCTYEEGSKGCKARKP